MSTTLVPLAPPQSVILANMIRLADHHRQHCDGETCNISLSCLIELFRLAGIPLTRSDMEHFL